MPVAPRARELTETPPGAERALTVSQVNQAIGAALQERFADAFWMVGEIQGYDRDLIKAGQRRWGQIYFELIEKESGADSVKAGIKALVWGDAHNAIRAKLKAASADLRLQDGLQVKFLCQVDFYWPRAGLQLKVLDVDPHFTLGDMERARRELIEKLKAQGLFDRNRSTELPLVPLTLGLVTSDGSAAYHDFVEELRSSGYAFALRFIDARMQGVETEQDVPRAIEALAADPAIDAVVLIRGGGSRSDLIWFDKEKIARAVTSCEKPVLTGIGHEIDSSVADLVAHTSRKTPTAVAQFLVERVRAYESGVLEAGRQLGEAARARLTTERTALNDAARDWREGTARSVAGTREALARAQERLKSGARRAVSLARERWAAVPGRLDSAQRGFFKSRVEKLTSLRKECEWRDPRRLLARGYSLIYAGGKLAKRLADIKTGEFIEARLVDGLVTANVLATKKEKP
ncbi:MAG: exodeoxyribonuclease VII large subunit [Elusimicrobia bacterium]|nr:exodeoxyribonuclease VII large subunit [Elusimicrobiota bacterium]MBK9429661.1 exodeoxyribonuclease VII large subunit [Elusimicrobiota bacterium]